MHHVLDWQVVYGAWLVQAQGRFMLLLAAILRLLLTPEPEPNDLLARTLQVIGHVGLAMIALVYILLACWQR